MNDESVARWTVVADGPDGFVEHFYADTDLRDTEVVLASEYDTLRQQLKWAVDRDEELRGWVTEALNTYPGAPSGEARQMLLNGLGGVTR